MDKKSEKAQSADERKAAARSKASDAKERKQSEKRDAKSSNKSKTSSTPASGKKEGPSRLSDLPRLELPPQLAKTDGTANQKTSGKTTADTTKNPPPLPNLPAQTAPKSGGPPAIASSNVGAANEKSISQPRKGAKPPPLPPTAATKPTPRPQAAPLAATETNLSKSGSVSSLSSKQSQKSPPSLNLSTQPTGQTTKPADHGLGQLLPTTGNTALALSPEPIPEFTPEPEQPSKATAEGNQRRASRRRPAGPPRDRIAANDDAPSIGGLIYALNQRPSKKPFIYAAACSGFWLVLAVAFGVAFMPGALSGGIAGTVTNPWFPTLIATILGPMALFGFLALLAWRAEELHMRSTAMTEVAVRLAEPDRMAEQSIASLGQAVRRQVSFMNDAVSRALGRAGELEALVHNEVAALEHSYEENERKIRGLINELAGERHSLVNTGEHFESSLQKMGVEIPQLMAQLSDQQLKLTSIIDGAGQNLTQLESALATQTGRFETSLGDRTTQLETVLTGYTQALGTAMDTRTENMQVMLGGYTDALGTSLGDRTTQLETVLTGYTQALGTAMDTRTENMQVMLGGYTDALGTALSSRTSQLQIMLEDKRDAIETNVGALRTTVETSVGDLQKTVDQSTSLINDTLTDRTETLQTVFEEYALALDTTLANRAEALDSQLVERTKALDGAFSERLRLFDESVLRSTMAIDSAVGENTKTLTNAMEVHARQLGDSIANQAAELDDTLMSGINSVRSTSENISRQSIKAIEGLASQSDLLRNVSENLLSQINSVTNRFENQGQAIMRSANALESTNNKIERSLAGRTEDLNNTLERMSGKAEELSQVVEGYSTSLEGSLTGAQQRARLIAEEISKETEARSRVALDDLQRVKLEASRETDRALDELRREFSNVSQEVTQRLGSLTNQFSTATGAVRDQASAAARDLEQEQERLKQQLDRLPSATEETASQMRRALSDQLRALDKLSTMANRSGLPDVSQAVTNPNPGLPAPQRPAAVAPSDSNGLSSLTSSLAREIAHRHPRTSPETPGPAPLQPKSQQDAWSLGDLLSRASETNEDDGTPRAAQAPTATASTGQQATPRLDINALSRALDPTTATTIWSRFQAGQRGFMVRSIYTPESRNLFDGIARRYHSDNDFKQLVDRFLNEYEKELSQADARDPSGGNSQRLIQSDTGRVYLVLAHASGRLI